MKFYDYKISRINIINNCIYQVFLNPAVHGINYTAGQYLFIKTNDGEQRPFSIANAPAEDGVIELHIRYAEEIPYSQQLIKQLQMGNYLQLSEAAGHTVFHPEINDAIIFLAGGTGIAPCKAIIEQLLKTNDKHDINIYWGVKNNQELYLVDLLNEWQTHYSHFNFIPVLSEPDMQSWHDRTGLVHHAIIQDYVNMSHLQVYAFGPFDMVFQARDDFIKQGLNTERMFADAFDFTNED